MHHRVCGIHKKPATTVQLIIQHYATPTQDFPLFVTPGNDRFDDADRRNVLEIGLD